MKYFANIHTADELRKNYRAKCITMHPDRGGNEEEFKAMQAEFEALKKQFQNGARAQEYTRTETAEERARRQAEEQREREEWARWEAEEKARREQEAREKAERIRKAQEVSRAAVRAWAAILERVNTDKTGEKARYYRFTDKKEAAAFVAATKRNIIKVINHYFPGLKVKISISGEIWKERFIINWEDGPSEKQLRDTCQELAYFIPSVYCCAGPCDDYGHHEERNSTAPWREAYGQALGDVDDFETVRTLSDEGKQQAEDLAARYFQNFDPKSDADKFPGNMQELYNLLKAAGVAESVRVSDIFRQLTNGYCSDLYGTYSSITGEISRRQLRKILTEHIEVNVTPREKAPEFVPTYGATYKAIKKALGANLFYREQKDSRKNAAAVLNIFEAAELLAKGEAVQIGKWSDWDGEAVVYGTDRGGYKTQQKRAAKFEAVGVLLEGTSYNTYGTINARGIKAETLEALRREAQDVERQRKEWEAKQNGTTTAQEATERTTANKPTDTTNEAPAEGLELVELADGLAVTGNSRTTYKHRRDIKAHGCTWNKQAQQWEAHSPEDCDTLRRWFALRDSQATATASEPTTGTDEQADTLQDGQNITDATTNEPEALRGATLQELERHSDRTAAPAWLKPGQTFKRTTADGREVVAICTKLILNGFAYITANGCAYNDHVIAFDTFDFDGVTACDIDDNAPEFARMLRNFQRIRKDFEEYQQAHPYEPTTTDTDPTPEPSGEGEEQADTLQDGQNITDPTTDEPRTVHTLLEAVADVLRTFADIMQQAAQWEGVTVPADTLARWKQEATEGTKTAAARLCEVCACLASLAPESRQDFDALGVIFWTLSEQMRNGYAPANLQGATDYARAQLFDLIERTQTANQARAIREATDPNSGQRAA